jgi:hypothetical protein
MSNVARKRRPVKLFWECVPSYRPSKIPEVWRAKVPGGWLLTAADAPLLIFYRDPKHHWDEEEWQEELQEHISKVAAELG